MRAFCLAGREHGHHLQVTQEGEHCATISRHRGSYSIHQFLHFATVKKREREPGPRFAEGNKRVMYAINCSVPGMRNSPSFIVRGPRWERQTVDQHTAIVPWRNYSMSQKAHGRATAVGVTRRVVFMMMMAILWGRVAGFFTTWLHVFIVGAFCCKIHGLLMQNAKDAWRTRPGGTCEMG